MSIDSPLAPGRVACVGDSITEGAGAEPGRSYPTQLQEMLGPAWEVGNFGVSGRTLLRKGDFPYWNEPALSAALAFAPQVVIVMLGTNDTKPQNWAHRAEFPGDYRDLLQRFQALPGRPRLFACLPCPVVAPGNFDITQAGVEAEIPWIRAVAAELGAGLIDMQAALAGRPELLPDCVHPNTAGAREMARAACRALTGRAPGDA